MPRDKCSASLSAYLLNVLNKYSDLYVNSHSKVTKLCTMLADVDICKKTTKHNMMTWMYVFCLYFNIHVTLSTMYLHVRFIF